jgi:uncharacterized membrane protein YeaQ/YmgE (transglycosylase-associated protein family)
VIFLILIALLLAIIVAGFIIKSLVGLALMLLVAGLIGALAGSWLNYKGGFLFSIGAGLIGAVVGTIIANILHLPKFPELFNLPLLWTVAGSVIVVAAAKVVAPRGDSKQLSNRDRALLR